MKPVIAITSGEPAGIGPDIIAAIKPADFDARLVVIGDRELLESRAAQLNSTIEYVAFPCDYPQPHALEVIHQPLARASQAGVLDADNAGHVLGLLDRACQGCLDGEFDAMVTAPLHKEIINRAGVPFTGHTEYLAGLCRAKPLMLLVAERLRVALVTTHLPLREVADAISGELIIDIVQILNRDLPLRFGLHHPHIKVCGLNPHAGENGYLGREEIDIIKPALQQLKASGINVSGPYPADTLFTPGGLADADAVLAMYHDQGLPVLKHAGFHNAVNTTLGLPIIRTSVDHGTALDLAASGKANPGSLFAAIHSAIFQSDCTRNHAAGA